jgi:hypothetical protein
MKRRTMAEWCAVFLGRTCSVIPYGARSNNIDQKILGKVPGQLNHRTGLWAGTAGSVVGRFMTAAEAIVADQDGAAVGLLAEFYPCIDIDVETEALSIEIVEIAFRILGPAPIRRREGSSRRALLYGGTILRKTVISWGDGNTVKKQAIEILGSGQYWNVDGRHPSGDWYYWEGTHPVDSGPHDLCLITPEMVAAFKAAVKELLGAQNIEIAEVGAGKREGLSTTPRTGLDNPSLHAPSPELVIEVLDGYRPEVLGHDSFVQHLAAIKAALGPRREEFYPDVLAWAPGVRSQETEATRKRWDSIVDASIGWDWLVTRTASPAAITAEFADPPDPEMMPADPGESMLNRIVDRWVFDASCGMFHDLLHGVDASKDSFNTIHASFLPYGLGGRKSAAAVCINDPRFRVTQGRTYQPGSPELVNERGVLLINLWRPSGLVPVEGDPTPWLDHVKKLFPEETAREHFLNWMAFVLQNPGKKIGHAIMLYSEEQGVGKDTALIPLVRGVGNANIAKIEPDDLTGQFTSYLKSQVIICNEMANFERRTVYNRLKAHLEMSDTMLPVNEKFQPRYQILNRQNWIFCTNDPNAVSLEATDRRFFVQDCPGPRMSADESDKLYAWLNSGGDAIAVWWLLQRDLSKFNPAHPPPMTAAKTSMIELSKPVAVRWLEDQFATVWAKREFMTHGEILDASGGFNVPANVSKQIHQGHVKSAFHKHGFVAIEGRHRVGSAVTTIWTRDKRPETLASSGQFLVARLAADRDK